MIGIILFILFLGLGLCISNRIFSNYQMYIRGWTGLLIGTLGLMWLVVPFSFFFGFGVVSHILALLSMAAIYLLVRKVYTQEGSLQYKRDGIDTVLYSLLVPLSLIVIYILNGHVIKPGENGLYGGQSTYGDLSLHLGIASSIATQGKFPPDYSIFPGQRLSYPFLGDSLSSSLYLFGVPLRWAILIPSYVMVIALIAGFFILSYEVLKHKYAALFSSVLFFINGGLGFIYFMDGLNKDSTNFTRIFKEFYQTPTNLNEHFIRWSNTICDMIIPQRTTLAGWTFVILCIWLVHVAITKNDRKLFVVGGILSGLLPMIHTHSFLALGIITLTWCFVYLYKNENIKEYIINWLYFGIPAAVLSLPQLIFWTFPQSTGGHFLKFVWGWQANEGDIWPWFWVKNVGVVFLLLIPAIFAARRKLISFYSGAITVFIIAEFIQFQPNNYDNNKIFYIWYMLSVILVSAYVFSIYKRMEGIRNRWIILAILIFFSTFSGALTIGREAKSNGEYQLFDKNAVAASEFIKKNTPPDSMFISSDNHNNPISALAGRNVLCGPGLYLFFHGVDQSGRQGDIEKMFTDPSSFDGLAAKYKVDYVYFSNYERSKFKSESSYFDTKYPSVFKSGDITIYAVSQRAKVSIKK